MNTFEMVTQKEDVEYVQRNFVALEEACREARQDLEAILADIADGKRPGPCYILGDGTWYVPADYFELETNRGAFIRRLLAAAVREGFIVDSDDLKDVWAGFITGIYGVCLRHATPENIAQKMALVRDIEARLAHPQADDPSWLESLRKATNRLDAIERQFSPTFDRRRFGRPPSRDTLIHDVRKQYLEPD